MIQRKARELDAHRGPTSEFAAEVRCALVVGRMK